MLKPRLLTATLLLLLFSTSSALGADKLRRYPRGVKNAYIVDVENKSTENVIRVAELARKQYKAKVTSVFTEIYGGFAIEAPESTALLLSHLPEVRAVHEVTEGWVTEAPVARTLSAQSWGLDRIDQRESIAGGDGRYTYYYRGDDVTVYVVDTGVDAVGDLQGRIDMHYTFDNDGDTQDCYGPGGGHGTKVASTIGGADFGVAKGVKMISVRAGCGQTPEIRSDQVVRGLAWITARHNSIQGALSVVNISLAFTANDPIDEAVRDAIAAGVVVVVGAGNDGTSACQLSPARSGYANYIPNNPNGYSAITVGAVDSADRYAVWSVNNTAVTATNTGRCVDIFAPGGPGLNAQGFNGPVSDWAGTSAAAPFVAGAAALALARFGDVSPGMIETHLIENSTKDRITVNPAHTFVVSGTPNRILYQVQPPKRRVCCS